MKSAWIPLLLVKLSRVVSSEAATHTHTTYSLLNYDLKSTRYSTKKILFPCEHAWLSYTSPIVFAKEEFKVLGKSFVKRTKDQDVLNCTPSPITHPCEASL